MPPDPPPPNRQVAVTPGGKTNVADTTPVPRPALTAFGPVVEFVTRSYAPWANFGVPGGLGFEGDGDDRHASTDPKATARITSVARLHTRTNRASFLAFSNESAWPALPFKHDQFSFWPEIIPHLQFSATAVPNVQGSCDSNGEDTLTIVMSHSGAMPLTPGVITPDIDLHTTFVITLIMGASIRVATTMTGDAFPNAEAFVRFSDGRAVMLHHFETSGSQDTGPAVLLPGDPKRPMGSTTVTVSPTRDT